MSSPELVPTARGFDSSLGYLAGAEDHWQQRPTLKIKCKSTPTVDGTQPVDLLRNGRPAIGLNGTEFGGDIWEKEALRVVQEHPLSAPLYLYYAFQDCHSPQQAPRAFTDLYPQLVDRCSGAKHATFCVIHYKNDHFTKTGSGQT
jgi:arylsulfatase B